MSIRTAVALVSLLALLIPASPSIAQPVATPITLSAQSPASPAPAWSVPGPRPTRAVHASVDLEALRAALAGAPQFREGVELHRYALTLLLPHPSGVMMPCFVAESPVMQPALAAKFPGMKTYIALSQDGLATGRIEVTQRGLTGMLREPADLSGAGGAWMIDRWRSGDDASVIAYWLGDLDASADWDCQVLEAPDAMQQEHRADAPQHRALGERRTARLAVACTGEYGLHQSTIEGNPPNAEDAFAAIITVVSRTNVVFENDLGVHFELVADNDQLVFFDPLGDPYPDTCDGSGGANCSSPILNTNTSFVRNTIGSQNFDVGHCLTRIAGGVAYLRSVCTNSKAGGVSGIPRGGDVDPLSALVIIHELGHQFGANHTFSGTRGRCENNVRLASAWEAGSGSSPMAYAGGCPVGDLPPSDNVAQFADPWFHHGSIEEMRTFLDGDGMQCLTPIATASSIPEIVSVSPDAAIPPGTPFTLTAQATDIDGDMLTYSWEQFNSGAARPLSGEGSEDTGVGALFRVFPPVASGSRTFPQWADVLAGVPTPGEQLPTFTGALRRFRVIVRDNAPLAGNTATSEYVLLEIASGASPFAVLAPDEGQQIGAGVFDVTWSVGSTDLAPISCDEVHIRLSTDGGSSFAYDLGTHPNTGAASVTLPSETTTDARIIVESVGNVFFALSRPFTLSGCVADVNGDGALSPADFTAWINAFNAQAPACDQNADGMCTPADFTAWVANYNAGC